jgi:hypothetical protein
MAGQMSRLLLDQLATCSALGWAMSKLPKFHVRARRYAFALEQWQETCNLQCPAAAPTLLQELFGDAKYD